jgi:hypothetical protein
VPHSPPQRPPPQPPELEANTARGTSFIDVTAKESFESEFYVAGQNVKAPEKEAIRGMWKVFEPFNIVKEVGLNKSQYVKNCNHNQQVKMTRGMNPTLIFQQQWGIFWYSSKVLMHIIVGGLSYFRSDCRGILARRRQILYGI